MLWLYIPNNHRFIPIFASEANHTNTKYTIMEYDTTLEASEGYQGIHEYRQSPTMASITRRNPESKL